jgi:hypothetical protein
MARAPADSCSVSRNEISCTPPYQPAPNPPANTEPLPPHNLDMKTRQIGFVIFTNN